MSQSAFPHLVSKVRIRGTIQALTGLHVGGSDVGLKVGGADKVVVKDPKTGRPYIPGSTLKGKMRCLLEKAGRCCGGQGLDPNRHNKRREDATIGPCHCGTCLVCQVFGVPAEEGRRRTAQQENTAQDAQPELHPEPVRCVGRLIVRDAHLDEECAKDMDTWRYLSAPFVEVKTEVSIDRLTSQANPRNFERVPAGTLFRFEFVLDVCQGDDAHQMIDLLLTGLQLVANDYLGGQGTRGYGAVRFRVETVEEMKVPKTGTGQFQPFALSGGVTLPWSTP